MSKFKPYLPGQPIAELPDLPNLWTICQGASYPVTFDFADGRVTYNASKDAYSNLWTRSMVRECTALGGVVNEQTA